MVHLKAKMMFGIPINIIIPALLAGNVVILKHSAKTPLCGKQFSRAFGDLVQDLVLDHQATAELIKDPRIQHVAFTGSVAGGREIYHAVGENRFIDVGLELGGNDPAYIAEDADLDFCLPEIASGAFYNAGQSCCGIERLYVHKNKFALTMS